MSINIPDFEKLDVEEFEGMIEDLAKKGQKEPVISKSIQQAKHPVVAPIPAAQAPGAPIALKEEDIEKLLLMDYEIFTLLAKTNYLDSIKLKNIYDLNRKLSNVINYLDRNKVKSALFIGKYVTIGVLTAGMGVIPLAISDVASKGIKHAGRIMEYWEFENTKKGILMKLKLIDEIKNEVVFDNAVKEKIKEFDTEKLEALKQLLNKEANIFTGSKLSTAWDNASYLFKRFNKAIGSIDKLSKVVFKSYVGKVDVENDILNSMKEVIGIQELYHEFCDDIGYLEDILSYDQTLSQAASELVEQSKNDLSLTLSSSEEIRKNVLFQLGDGITTSIKELAIVGPIAAAKAVGKGAKDLVIKNFISSYQKAIDAVSQGVSSMGVLLAVPVVQSLFNAVDLSISQKKLKADLSVDKLSDEQLLQLYETTRFVIKTQKYATQLVDYRAKHFTLSQQLSKNIASLAKNIKATPIDKKEIDALIKNINLQQKELDELVQKGEQYALHVTFNNQISKEIKKRFHSKLYEPYTGLVEKHKRIFNTAKKINEKQIDVMKLDNEHREAFLEISNDHAKVMNKCFEPLKNWNSKFSLSEYSTNLSAVMKELVALRNNITKPPFQKIKALFLDPENLLFEKARQNLQGKLLAKGRSLSDATDNEIYDHIFYPIDRFLKLMSALKEQYDKCIPIDNEITNLKEQIQSCKKKIETTKDAATKSTLKKELDRYEEKLRENGGKKEEIVANIKKLHEEFYQEFPIPFEALAAYEERALRYLERTTLHEGQKLAWGMNTPLIAQVEEEVQTKIKELSAKPKAPLPQSRPEGVLSAYKIRRQKSPMPLPAAEPKPEVAPEPGPSPLQPVKPPKTNKP